METTSAEIGKTQSILIVDDNPQNLQVLGRLLQERNYEIEFATNGVTALDWLNSRMFDLILLDINMPEMDGFEVCRRIRADERMNRMPVIFLSADNDRESILKGFELGGQDYVTKPFDSRELIVRVRTHISLKESLEELERLNKSLEDKVRERTQQLRVANGKLEEMNNQLMELDNAKSEFLSLISHEIRTPLNGIILPVEMLRETVAPDEIRELVGILDDSVSRLEHFATNALLLTRLKTRPNEINRRKTNLASLIEKAIEQEQQTISLKNLNLRKKQFENSREIEAEEDLLLKGICCIIDNAVVFSPTNGIIEIQIKQDDSKIIVEISDSGHGFLREILDKGASTFSRGSDYRDKATGIGIPLAGMILSAHGGELSLNNRQEGGAMVRLILPA
ncbi:MAG: hybrid sensor histidine kinase/response regulator [Bacteroidales bacterium]